MKSESIFLHIVLALWFVFGMNDDAMARQAQPAGDRSGTAKQEEPRSFKAPDWQSVRPTGAKASVQMPVKPRFVERPFSPIKDKPPIVVKLHLGTTHQGKTTFVFGYHDLHETPIGKDVDSTLNGAVRGSVANVLGQLVAEPTKIKYKETMGRQFVYQCQQQDRIFIVTTRTFLKGKRLYQVSCIMEDGIFDEQIASKYLNSFRYSEFVKDLPPRPPSSN